MRKKSMNETMSSAETSSNCPTAHGGMVGVWRLGSEPPIVANTSKAREETPHRAAITPPEVEIRNGCSGRSCFIEAPMQRNGGRVLNLDFGRRLGSAPYAQGEKPPKDKPSSYGAPPPTAPGAYGAGPHPPHVSGGYGVGAPPSAPSGYPSATPPPPYGSPFASLLPSQFPPGTDPSVVACFQMADRDGSGFIDDKELQSALSSYNQSFSMRTVHLLMYNFTNTNTRKIGPKEFTAVFYSLQNWRAIFERFDRDRSGKIDTNELREALLSLGFVVSPVVLDLLVSKFDKTGGKNRAIEYDNFIECCLTVKGLTEKFKEKDTMYSGSATFTYEAFMLTVLPFLIA